MIHRLLYTGWGPLIALAGFVCLLLTQYVVNAIMLDDQFYTTHAWPKMLAMWIAAAVSWPIGRALKRKGGRNIRDTAPPNAWPVEDHSLLFIPAHYWWIVFLLLGVILFFL
jgi:hypothetical protein